MFEVAAARAAINACRLLGGAVFSRTLVQTVKTHHDTSSSVKASLLSAMASFLKTYETELDDDASGVDLADAGIAASMLGMIWNRRSMPRLNLL